MRIKLACPICRTDFWRTYQTLTNKKYNMAQYTLYISLTFDSNNSTRLLAHTFSMQYFRKLLLVDEVRTS
jgi:hypothetical protein